MKRKLVYLSLAAFMTLSLQSCYTTHNLYGAIYDIRLSSVESPADAKKQFGETKIVNYNDEVGKYRFEDDYIDIVWYVSKDRFNFELKNKTNHTIKINWDEVTFVDFNGEAKRVIHQGVKYVDRNAAQPSSTIPRGTRVNDFLVPSENIYYHNYYAQWTQRNIIPVESDSEEKLRNTANMYKGKRMSIMMPLKIEDTQNDYIFEFEVGDDVKIDDKSYEVYDATSSQLAITLGSLVVSLLVLLPFM